MNISHTPLRAALRFVHSLLSTGYISDFFHSFQQLRASHPALNPYFVAPPELMHAACDYRLSVMPLGRRLFHHPSPLLSTSTSLRNLKIGAQSIMKISCRCRGPSARRNTSNHRHPSFLPSQRRRNLVKWKEGIFHSISLQASFFFGSASLRCCSLG